MLIDTESDNLSTECIAKLDEGGNRHKYHHDNNWQCRTTCAFPLLGSYSFPHLCTSNPPFGPHELRHSRTPSEVTSPGAWVTGPELSANRSSGSFLGSSSI